MHSRRRLAGIAEIARIGDSGGGGGGGTSQELAARSLACLRSAASRARITSDALQA